MSLAARASTVTLRAYATRTLQIVVLVALVSLVAGAVIGQPVLLSYVETGSMAPTVNAGDGFIAVPSILAGPPSEGDVVVYRAEQLQGGGLTTHRIVDRTDRGYVTKGDANPFTDQDGGEPPVTEGQIVAHALEIGGAVVVLPHLGTAVIAIQTGMITVQNWIAGLLGVDLLLGPQGVGAVLVVVGATLFVLSFVLGDGRSRTRTRTVSRSETLDVRAVTLALLVVVLLPANVAMIVPGGVHEMNVDGDTVTQSPDISAGDPIGWEYEISNRGFVPVVVVFESTDADVSVPQYRRTLAPGSSRTVSIAIDAPAPGERRTGTVREYHYLPFLPPSAIGWLHGRHPFLAWAVLNVVVAVPFVAVLRRVGTGGRIRPSTSPLVARLRRRFR